MINAFLNGRRPIIPAYSVCVECKLHATPCVMVSQGTPCLGPVTQAGCGGLCPTYNRGCFGCYGPQETANTASLAEWWRKLGVSDRGIMRVFRTFNANAAPFKEESKAHEH